MRCHQEQNALEELLHALGHQAADQLNAPLAGADGCRHCCLGAGLQRVSIKAHRGLAHSGAVLADLVDVLQHWKRRLANKGRAESLHHARSSHPDDGASLVVQDVINVYLALDDSGPRMDALRQAVQRIAQDLALDLLDVVRDVKDGHRLEWAGMWLWIARKVHERYVTCRQVAHNLVAGAHAAYLAQLRDTVLVKVNSRVCLDVQHPAHHRVGALNVAAVAGAWLACQILLVGVQVGAGDVLFDFVLLVAHRHQVHHCGHLAVSND